MYLINLCIIILTWYRPCLSIFWQTLLCYILFFIFYKKFSMSWDIYCDGVW